MCRTMTSDVGMARRGGVSREGSAT
jgi:hypothetical protein